MQSSRARLIAFGGASAVSGILGISVADAANQFVFTHMVSGSDHIQPIPAGQVQISGAVNFKADPVTYPITVYDDFRVPASGSSTTVTSQVCREAWNGTTAACGTAASATYAASGSVTSRELVPSASGVQATTNSVYDYYYVNTYARNGAGAAVTITHKGVGINQ